MPVHVRKAKGSGFDIVEKSGKKKGHSATKRKAAISAGIRNRAIAAAMPPYQGPVEMFGG